MKTHKGKPYKLFLTEQILGEIILDFNSDLSEISDYEIDLDRDYSDMDVMHAVLHNANKLDQGRKMTDFIQKIFFLFF